MENNPLFDLLDFVAPFLGFDRERFERFVCWARYLHWADLNRRRYLAWEEGNGESDDWKAMWELLSLQSAFYASRWVVVEGWREVPLSDPYVDELFAANPRYLDLLKRYSNSVFHYQPTHGAIHRKQIGLLAEGKSVTPWLCLLHYEFCRVYWEKLPRAAPHADERYARRAAELVAEIRNCMLALVGWIPSDIPGARAEKLREMSEAAMARLSEAGDFESDEAVRLLNLARQVPGWITEAKFEYERLRREAIDRVRASAQANQAPTDRIQSGGLLAPPGGHKVQ